MATEQQIRKYIRKVLSETVNNFLKKEKETKTKQLKDNSKSEVLGDPISDIEMNQLSNNLGSDEKRAPTVSVTAGATKGGSDVTTGMKTPKFSNKTKLAK